MTIRVLLADLTTFHEDESVRVALRAGAAGFLLKDTPPDDLLRAIRDVPGGHSALGMTEGTVQGHVSSILAKLGADSRVRAARIACRAGLDDQA
ncbi:LuxR C-terminal-related transcriptional regulator [Streptomyces sp. NPDC055157]